MASDVGDVTPLLPLLYQTADFRQRGNSDFSTIYLLLGRQSMLTTSRVQGLAPRTVGEEIRRLETLLWSAESLSP